MHMPLRLNKAQRFFYAGNVVRISCNAILPSIKRVSIVKDGMPGGVRGAIIGPGGRLAATAIRATGSTSHSGATRRCRMGQLRCKRGAALPACGNRGALRAAPATAGAIVNVNTPTAALNWIACSCIDPAAAAACSVMAAFLCVDSSISLTLALSVSSPVL